MDGRALFCTTYCLYSNGHHLTYSRAHQHRSYLTVRIHLKTEFFIAGLSLVWNDFLETDRDVLSIMMGGNRQLIGWGLKFVEPSGLLFLRCEATIGQKVETKLLSCPFCPSRCGAIYLFKKKREKDVMQYGWILQGWNCVASLARPLSCTEIAAVQDGNKAVLQLPPDAWFVNNFRWNAFALREVNTLYIFHVHVAKEPLNYRGWDEISLDRMHSHSIVLQV
jgi:hypothetical protein